MNISVSITDTINEILNKIIDFTQKRQKILTQNINCVNDADFIPKDLPVEQFSEIMNNAITEHICNQHLIFYDTENIKFGVGNSLQIDSYTDYRAYQLLKKDKNQYLELQINKLLENSLNQKVAAELLKQKQQTVS